MITGKDEIKMADEKEMKINTASLLELQLKRKYYEQAILHLIPDSTEWKFLYSKLLEIVLEEQCLGRHVCERCLFEKEARAISEKYGSE